MKTLLKTLSATLLAATLSSVAMADPFNYGTSASLADLTANSNNYLTIGDKTFNNFNFLNTNLTNFNASQIAVTASISGGVYYLTWGGSMALSGANFGPAPFLPLNADLLLNYTVTASAGKIDWIDQSYTGSFTGSGPALGQLGIDENVYSGVNLVANSHLQIGDLSDSIGFAEVGDDLYIVGGATSVNVTKDIAFALQLGIGGGGTVSISEVRQSFHQSTVPDGGTTALLLGAGLLGLSAFASRRRSMVKVK